MMLGKRARHQMRRTTSMTGITVELGDEAKQPPFDPHNKTIRDVQKLEGPKEYVLVGPSELYYSSNGLLSPRYNNMQGGEGDNCLETANFLRTCGLCKRRLAPRRDIYMYRGDTAFCSVECREQQMKHDGWGASKKDAESHHKQSHSSSTTAASKASNNSEAVAAA